MSGAVHSRFLALAALVAASPVAALVPSCGPSRDDRGEITYTPREGDTEGQEPADPAVARRARFGALVVGEDACQSDADCVPAGCCHADACVARTRAPDCGGVMCTQECRYGTLDCGGRCLCHEGRCAARLSSPTEPELAPQQSPPQEGPLQGTPSGHGAPREPSGS